MNRLKELREKAGMTQREIAEKLFLHTTQYFRYESGKSDMPLQFAIKIAQFYNVTIDYIAGISEDKGERKEETVDQIFAKKIKKLYKEMYEEK